MTLDRRPSDAELLRRKALQDQRAPNTHHNGIALGPKSLLATPQRRKRSAMNDDEHQEQGAFMTWCREPAQLAEHPDLWLFYAIPNFMITVGSPEIRAAMGKRANDEGRRKGMLDTHLPVARGRWHSLYVEFKAEGGQPTKEQREWIARLRAAGNRVEVIFTADAAKAIALHYLSLPILRL